MWKSGALHAQVLVLQAVHMPDGLSPECDMSLASNDLTVYLLKWQDIFAFQCGDKFCGVYQFFVWAVQSETRGLNFWIKTSIQDSV